MAISVGAIWNMANQARMSDGWRRNDRRARRSARDPLNSVADITKITLMLAPKKVLEAARSER